MILAMPVLAIPALLRGSVDDDLLGVSGGGAGAVRRARRARHGGAGARPPARLARPNRSSARNRLRPSAEPLQQLPDRLVRERDRILETLGPRWKRAVLATVGRWTFDYATLLAAVAAVGDGDGPGWCCSPSAPRRSSRRSP